MAKIYLNRLKSRYGYKGERYSGLINRIIANNSEGISRKIATINKTHWGKALQRITTKTRKFIVPRVEEVLPKRSIFVRKSATQGKLISDNLRDKLTKHLRDTLTQFTPKMKEPVYLKRKGEVRGKINVNLIDDFESRIKKTFENYTKRDKRLKMPTNIHEIAVTEMRGSVNPMKNAYMDKLQEKNKDKLQMIKIWKHNKSLSKQPRRGHMHLNGAQRKLNQSYSVALYKRLGGRWLKVRTDKMQYPHDPEAPADQIIGCNCDVQYFAKEIKK